jgi:hypothetical protein
MNSILALPIASAVPVASAALANSLPSQDDEIDYAAMFARAEKAIETFRTRFGGFFFWDLERANRNGS